MTLDRGLAAREELDAYFEQEIAGPLRQWDLGAIRKAIASLRHPGNPPGTPEGAAWIFSAGPAWLTRR